MHCTNLMSKTIMEQAAYIHACADNKQLNLDKYKNDIQKEMNKTVKKGNKCKPDESKQGKNSCGVTERTLTDKYMTFPAPAIEFLVSGNFESKLMPNIFL